MDLQQQAYLRKCEIPFTMVANQIIFDNRISSKAKFYYVYLSSKPNDWKFHANCIIKEIKEGKEAFYSGLKELIAFGYLERKQITEAGKFKHTEYILKIPQTEKPYTEKPYTVNTDTKNQYYNNTNNNNTDNIKKDNNNINSQNEILTEKPTLNENEKQILKTQILDKIDITEFNQCKNLETIIKKSYIAFLQSKIELPSYVDLSLFILCVAKAHKYKKKSLASVAFKNDIKAIMELYNANFDIHKCLIEWSIRQWQAIRIEYYQDNYGKPREFFLLRSNINSFFYGKQTQDNTDRRVQKIINPLGYDGEHTTQLTTQSVRRNSNHDREQESDPFKGFGKV